MTLYINEEEKCIKMSLVTDRKLCEMSLSVISGTGDTRCVIEWAASSGLRTVVGIDLLGVMVMSNLSGGKYGRLEKYMCDGVVRKTLLENVGDCASLKDVPLALAGIDEGCVELLPIGKMSNIVMSSDNLNQCCTEYGISARAGRGRYVLKFNPMNSPARNNQVVLDERKSIIVDFAELTSKITTDFEQWGRGSGGGAKPGSRGSVRYGEFIKQAMGVPNLTVSAELCVQMLSIAKERPEIFGDRGLQELVAYTRTIINNVSAARRYETDIHANIVDAIEALLGPEDMSTLTKAASNHGLDLTSYIGTVSDSDTAAKWYNDTLSAITNIAFKGGNTTCFLCSSLSSPTHKRMELDEMKAHIIYNHAEELQIPPEIPSLRQLMANCGISSRKADSVSKFLATATKHDIPIVRTSIFIPFTWTIVHDLLPIYREFLIRRSFLTSLDLSEARLYNAMDMFYSNVRYDAMRIFAENTDILSSNEAFGCIAPPKLPVPHAFQRTYLNRILANMMDAIAANKAKNRPEPEDEDSFDNQANIQDPSVVIDVATLASELRIPSYGESIPDKFVAYVQQLCGKVSMNCGMDTAAILFAYACRRSASYDLASLENPTNFRNRHLIAAVAIMRVRNLAKYRGPITAHAERFVNLHADLLKMGVEEDGSIYAAMEALAESRRNARPSPTTGMGAAASTTAMPDIELSSSALVMPGAMPDMMPLNPRDLQFTTPISEFANDSMADSQISPNFSNTREVDDGFGRNIDLLRTQASPDDLAKNKPLTIEDIVATDINAILILVTKLGNSGEISIYQNSGDLALDYMRANAGTGKTTTAKMGGCVIRNVKIKFAGSLPPFNFELVYVCDQPLVRAEIFNSMKLLGSDKCKTSIATLSAVGRLEIESNFEEETSRTVNGRLQIRKYKPKLKSSTRDMFIMSSEVLILYVLGRRDGATMENDKEGSWYGNHNAFVFIDEFGAKLGNIQASNALAEAEGNELRIVKSFQEYAQSMLILSNATSLLTLVGASMVPMDMIQQTIASHQIRNVKSNSETGGKIYVGSQMEMPWGEGVNLWNVCPEELLGDLFIGLREPLLRRTVGHNAALQLRARIIEKMKATGPESVMYGRLKEMTEYLSYDLGVYNGDSIANYAVGLLYFLYLYAHQYVAPGPELNLFCGDMQNIMDGLQMALPFYAPWPKSHFVRQSEIYRAETMPAPPDFLKGLGISGSWNRGVRPEALRLMRAKGMLDELRQFGTYINAPTPVLDEICATGLACRESLPLDDLTDIVVKDMLVKKRPLPAPLPAGRPVVVDSSVGLILGAISVDVKSTTPWTVLGRCVQELRIGIKNTNFSKRPVTLVLDTDPLEIATATLAGFMHMKPEALIARAESVMGAAQRRYDEELSAAKRRFENQMKRDGRPNGNAVINGPRGEEGAGAGRVIYEPADPTTITNIADALGSINSHKNPITGRNYICPGAPEMSNLERYLLSFDIVVIRNNCTEYDLMKLYGFIKENKGRACMIFLSIAGTYGINVELATTAIITPRTACAVSVQTILQYLCRAGREGMSDNATSPMDLLTIVRILEHGIHETDGALFPNIYATLREFRESGASKTWGNSIDKNCVTLTKDAEARLTHVLQATGVKGVTRWNWKVTTPVSMHKMIEDAEFDFVNVADTFTRQSITAFLNRAILEYGQSNRDCQILDMFVGSLQHHLHEPFGVGHASTSTALEIRPIWPRRSDGGSETELLLTALEYASRTFSQARDRSAFALHDRFMLVRTDDGSTAASRIIKKIADKMSSKITNAGYGIDAKEKIAENSEDVEVKFRTRARF